MGHGRQHGKRSLKRLPADDLAAHDQLPLHLVVAGAKGVHGLRGNGQVALDLQRLRWAGSPRRRSKRPLAGRPRGSRCGRWCLGETRPLPRKSARYPTDLSCRLPDCDRKRRYRPPRQQRMVADFHAASGRCRPLCRNCRTKTTTSATPTPRNGSVKSVISQSGRPRKMLRTAMMTKTDTVPFQATEAASRPKSVQPGDCG